MSYEVYALVSLTEQSDRELCFVARLANQKDAGHMVERYNKRGVVACYMHEDGGDVVFNRMPRPANASRFIGLI